MTAARAVPAVYSDPEDPDAFSFEGTRPALAELAGVIRDAAAATETVITLSNGQVRVTVNDDARFSATRRDRRTLDVAGNADRVLWFASQVQTYADREDFGPHMHMEHVPGHPYWKPGSHPLLIVDAER